MFTKIFKKLGGIRENFPSKYARQYLKYYGYLDEDDNLERAIKQFQRIVGLKVDGILGAKTLRTMTWKRCGCKDVSRQFGRGRPGGPPKWKDNNLNYFIEKRDSDVSSTQWDAAIERAFSSWSRISNLSFNRVSSKNDAQLVMSTGSGRSDGFDGPNGTLAWAELPPVHNYQGRLLTRNDEAEKWVVNPNSNGILLDAVVAHEIGHLLGLEHSDVDGALMAPFYNPNIRSPQGNDIDRIQELYGKPENKNLSSKKSVIIEFQGKLLDVREKNE